MDELGLFPLGIVLVPTERVPLHIFELRYQELIGTCLDEKRDFGLVFADDEGMRRVGTRAAVLDVLDRFPDGRLNIVVEGRERFRVLEETKGRSFLTATVEAVADDDVVSQRADRERALELYRALGRIVDQAVEEPDLDSGILSFELAARVDFGVVRKQELLELRSEPARLRHLCPLLEAAIEAVQREREIRERAATNGKVSHG